MVDTWRVNGIDKDSSNADFSATITDDIIMQEGKENIIKIDYTTKSAIKAKLQFDPEKIKCFRNGEIPPGTIVKEKEWINFHAIVDENTVIAWYRNDVDLNISSSGWGTKITGSMMADDTDGQKVIKVRYTIK